MSVPPSDSTPVDPTRTATTLDATEDRGAETIVVALEWLMLGLLVGLIGLSLPLWSGPDCYPRVPFFAGLRQIPDVLDFGLIWVIGAGFVLVLAGLIGPGFRLFDEASQRAKTWRRFGWGCVAAELLLSMLLNQHRLQVWAWQGFWTAGCFAFLPAHQTLLWLRRFTIAIYFYSAISKCDASFVQTYGLTLLEGFFKALPLIPEPADSVRKLLVWGLPTGELLVAGMLAVQRTRYLGWCLSLVMHLGLIVTLGPAGMQQHPPVLIWNFFFLLQNTLLFSRLSTQAPRERKSEPSAPQPQQSLSQQLWTYLLVIVLIFPATEWVGIGDVWPSWGLYSSRGARVRLYLTRDAAGRLSEELQPHLRRTTWGPDWLQLDLHRWSFATLNVPSYPQDRFQLGVAEAVIASQPPSAWWIVHESPANRWTGTRHKTDLRTITELETFRKRYRLNSRTR